jgi:hypothetical protein
LVTEVVEREEALVVIRVQVREHLLQGGDGVPDGLLVRGGEDATRLPFSFARACNSRSAPVVVQMRNACRR